jgi:hypothetical protein
LHLKIWVLNLTLPLTICMTMGKLLCACSLVGS